MSIHFYFFCALQSNYLELVIEYADFLQTFTHEVDLLLRLMRDLSLELIDQGRVHMSADQLDEALDCFQRARQLELTANVQDTLNPQVLTRLHQLGATPNDDGLIKTAEVAIEAKRQRQRQIAGTGVSVFMESVQEELGTTDTEPHQQDIEESTGVAENPDDFSEIYNQYNAKNDDTRKRFPISFPCR